MLENKTCFLFDLDGTLIDSSALHETAYLSVLGRYAPDIIPQFHYEIFKGQKTADVFRSLMDGKDEATISLMASEKQIEYRKRITTELQIIPNALELLDYLDKMERRLFLVTSSSKQSVAQGLAFAGLERFFDGIVTGDNVDKHKPDPEPYLVCLEKYSLNAEYSLAIEDAENGIISAKSAGLDVIGVNNSNVAALDIVFFPDLFALGQALGQRISMPEYQ